MAKQVWQAKDGSIHASEKLACLHDLDTQVFNKKSVPHYLDTYAGRELLKMHSWDEYGLWQIKGEDPNCDRNNPHNIQPDLGVLEGALKDVIATAVEMPHFWSWGGGGGSIWKINTRKV